MLQGKNKTVQLQVDFGEAVVAAWPRGRIEPVLIAGQKKTEVVENRAGMSKEVATKLLKAPVRGRSSLYMRLTPYKQTVPETSV